MLTKTFQTMAEAVMTECCEGMRVGSVVAVNVVTPSGIEVVRGLVQQVKRLDDNEPARFEISIKQ